MPSPPQNQMPKLLQLQCPMDLLLLAVLVLRLRKEAVVMRKTQPGAPTILFSHLIDLERGSYLPLGLS